MGIFSLFSKKNFISIEEEAKIVSAIRTAERKTSGEIRVYIESHCKYMDPLDRATEVFYGLKMDQTTDHNGVLVYVAFRDHQLAIFGDEGIHRKTGEAFWRKQVNTIVEGFRSHHFDDGMVAVITELGDVLHAHFPYHGEEDKNELPDEIVFGR